MKKKKKPTWQQQSMWDKAAQCTGEEKCMAGKEAKHGWERRCTCVPESTREAERQSKRQRGDTRKVSVIVHKKTAGQ